jgi:exodeoxyribonuclease V alpha subunit
MDSNSNSTNPNHIYEFDGTITAEKFYSSESNWGCFLFKTETALPNTEASKNFLIPKEDRDKVKQYYYGTMTGKVQRLYPNTLYHFKAKKEFNKKYQAWQYSVISAETDTPKSVEDQKNFLLSICTEGQVNTLLEAYPDIVEGVVSGKYDTIDLEKTKGIKEYYWNLIKTRILENYVMADILAMLIPIGVSYAKVKKLLNDEPNPLVLKQKLLDDPYIIVDVPGLSFSAVDKIALKLKSDLLVSTHRTTAFLKNYLKEIGESNGHTWVTKDELDVAVKENIIECEEVYKTILEDEKEKQENSQRGFLHIEGNRIGLQYYWWVEKEIYRMIIECSNSKPLPITQEEIDRGIKKSEEDQGFEFTPEQRELLQKMTTNNFNIITGKSGCGKTTLTRGLLNIYSKYSIGACSLSSKAAKRIEEVTGHTASTIHRILKAKGVNQFEHDRYNPLEYSVILVDEISMCFSGLFYHLISAIRLGSKIILVGDGAQIAPLGFGNLLVDLVNKENIQVNFLTKILRQAEKSAIVTDANLLREGIDPLNNKKSFKEVRGENSDMYYMFRSDKNELFNIAVNTYIKTIKDVGIDNVYLITPRKENCQNSTKNFNKKIQDLLIDDSHPYVQYGKDNKFKEGDKVIHRVNNYDLGVMNGEQGYVTEIYDMQEGGGSGLVVKYGDKYIEYDKSTLSELSLAYSLTVHLAQGSEADTVIVVLDSNSYVLLNNCLLYTAVTRARSRCLLLSEPFSYDHCVITNVGNQRNTWTKYFN